MNWRGSFAPALAAACAISVEVFCGSSLAADPKPLVQAHAHNDYAHDHPLTDALSHGFCGVEADIFLVNGALLVGHDAKDLRSDRTLQKLYLDPLRERARKSGGHIYPNGPEFTLLIDVKSEAAPAYAALRDVLANYAEMLTVFRTNSIEMRAVTVVISGNRARELMVAEPIRHAALDGRLPDLDGNDSKFLVPLVSDNWTKHFKWTGEGEMPNDEREKLAATVRKAHQQGRRIRFWATADTPRFWTALRDAGVDLINTDDLAGLERFLTYTPAR
jgi:hypothetical protein